MVTELMKACRSVELTIRNASGVHMPRRPEESPITDAPPNVAQYDQAMNTKLAVSYAVILELLYRTGFREHLRTALDLACGPGHFTLCLAKYLHCEYVRGLDLSEKMVAVANQNASRLGLAGKVAFVQGNILDPACLGEGPYDLVTLTHAAHHLTDLASVRRVLETMSERTHSEGMVVVADLVRLQGADVTDRYVDWLGTDYVKHGLGDFLQDFRNSMYAAWTEDELASAVPESKDRNWVQLVPRGLPTVQFILGLPVEQPRLFLRRGKPWDAFTHPVPPDMRLEHRLLRWSLFWFGRCRWLHLAKPVLSRTPTK